jgi:mono/diheme cytochrome c family protein
MIQVIYSNLSSLTFFLLLLLFSLGYSCSGAENKGYTENIGKSLFEKNCSICHGNDGKLMAAGAPDLTKSILSPEATLSAIELGSPQKGMPAYGKRLGKEELEKLRDYVLNFRKNQ